ncbi:hypothetical protein ACNSOL_12170 (plasmid) [Aliarcobacter lanthieri]|uniref:hypothetical protein n=1 Tax=Aliarcobacter lanthieri TaxID=1355374 RepID=UPI003AAB08B8
MKEQLLQKAKPIIFNTKMVKAILDGRKKQVRRVVGDVGISEYFNVYTTHRKKGKHVQQAVFMCVGQPIYINYKYEIGDILWVRETFAENFGIQKRVVYKAEFNNDAPLSIKWKPSIHMPKKYARIFLKVTNVRIERLQDISDEDCISEGIISEQSGSDSYVTYYGKPDWENHTNVFTDSTRDGELISLEKLAFKTLWNSTEKGYKWEDNSYVFVYEFERIENVN